MGICNISRLALLPVSVALVLSACTWVKPEEGTEAVALVKPQVVQNCQKLGQTNVKVTDKLAFINRSDKKVAQELLTEARNAALLKGADSIVAEGEEVDGKQTFGLYRCR